MPKVQLVATTRYDGSKGYEVRVDGAKIAEVYQGRDGSPIMARDARYAVGFRAAMVWRVSDRVRSASGEWIYATGLTWRTRKAVVEWVLKATGNAE